uniref:Uncharacterized protein n=1 Tax=Colletotrichum fructicola (strain Nara gc5) TaxID=1213859 RepID=L2FSG4_COLFN
MLRPESYRLLELMQYCIDHFIEAVFGKAAQNFSFLDLMWSKGNGGLNWERIGDFYCVAERSFHDQKFRFRAGRKKHSLSGLKVLRNSRGLDQARCQVRLLLRAEHDGYSRALAKVTNPSALHRLKEVMAPPSIDVLRTRHRIFIVNFWRLCHRLLRNDLAWPQYGYSYVQDFLLELEIVAIKECGPYHPLYKLLVALVKLLGEVSKADMLEVLSLGVSRTIQSMAPGVTSGQKRSLVFRRWTADMRQTC